MAGRWLPPAAPGGDEPERPERRRPPIAAGPDGGQPTFVQPPPQDHNPTATAALVLGIFGLVVLLVSLGLLFVVSLPVSAAAWIVGVKGRRKADRGEAGQRGMAQAGMVLGIVGVGLGVLALIVWTLLFALGEDLLDDIERELEELEEQDDDFERDDEDGTFIRAAALAAARVAGRAVAGL